MSRRSGLDPEVRQSLYRILADLAGGGTTVLLSSHALEELEGRVERVIILGQGRVVADGSIGELRRLARLPVRLRLTLADAAMPDWLGGIAGLRRIDDRTIELSCPPEAKLALLHTATGDRRITDLDLLPPTLDELYAHFLSRDAEAGA